MAKSVLTMSVSNAATDSITPSDRTFVESSNVYPTEPSVMTTVVGPVVTSPWTTMERSAVVNVVQVVPSVI